MKVQSTADENEQIIRASQSRQQPRASEKNKCTNKCNGEVLLPRHTDHNRDVDGDEDLY